MANGRIEIMEFQKQTYNFNDRFILNDVTTDPTEYSLVDANVLDTIAVNTEEQRTTDAGIIDYGTALGKGISIIPVMLYASTLAKMAELIQTFKTAFNPDLLEADPTYGLSVGKDGYMPFKWTETVGATSRAFMVYLKSVEIPKVNMDPMGGLIRQTQLSLKAQDPRKYLQTQSTLSGAGAAVNAGTYPTPVEITITASGATATNLTIANSTRSESMVISTALANADVLVIDIRLHSVKLNGVERRDYLSAASKWVQLSPGSNTLALTNITNAAIVTKWYSAWPL